MLGRTGDESIRIRPHDLGKIARVIEVRVAEEDELGFNRGEFLHRRTDVPDPRPRRVRETSRAADVGVEDHDVPLERGDEAADADPGEDDPIVAHRSGLRVDVVEPEELLAGSDRLGRKGSRAGRVDRRRHREQDAENCG